MEWTRNLKRYMSGDDVRAVKDKLVELGFLYKSTHNRFGDDTFRAVKAFQAQNGLVVDGVVGIMTWTTLFGAEPKPTPASDVPLWIAEPARTEIAQALAQVSAKRREICLMVLQYCVDRNTNPTILRGFYIRGANLVDKDLSVHVMTQSRLNSYFNKSSYAPYYDNGRESMMRSMAKASGYTIVGADCSGFIVGLWRKAGVVRNDFDATADHLYSSYCVPTSTPKAGDLVHKSGHIGLCVSPSLVVECGGGAYGIQLGQRKKRRLLDFRDRSVYSPGAWQHCGDPKVY